MDRLTFVREIQTTALNTSVIGAIKCYRNNTYSVSMAVRRVGHMGLETIIHITVSRIDHQPISSWTDLQAIKNQLLSDEHTAVQVYPPESQLTDAANCYHLWAHPDPSFRLPFGLNPGRVVTHNK